jgi:HEAT repeat protein
VVAIVAKLSPESEPVPSVRAAPAAALGEIGDASARAAVQAAAADDTDHFVRDAATIALRRL